MSIRIVQAQKFQLKTPLGISDSVINLVSFSITKPNGDVYKLTMEDFGEIGAIVVEPGTSKKEENITFTGVVQNSDGSATLTGAVRGRSMVYPYDSDTASITTHSAFVTVILSNSTPFYESFLNKENDESINGIYTYNQRPKLNLDSDSTVSEELVTVGQLLRAALGGATYVGGNTIKGTAGENITLNNIVYLDQTTGKWFKSLASNETTFNGKILGLAKGTITANNLIPNGVFLYGYMSGFSGLTIGPVYVSDTGAVSNTAGTNSYQIGMAFSTTEILFDSNSVKLLNNEKLGLSNSYPATLSTTNPVLTKDLINVSTQRISQITEDQDYTLGQTDITTQKVKIAQTFIPVSDNISSVIFKKGTAVGTVTGNVILNIYQDNAGGSAETIPSTTSLATVTITSTAYNALSNNTEITFTLSSALLGLDITKKYWLVLSTSVLDNTNLWKFRAINSNAYTNGGLKHWNTTDGWESQTKDLYFKINNLPIGKVPVTDSTGTIGLPYMSSGIYKTTDINYFSLKLTQTVLTASGTKDVVFTHDLGFIPSKISIQAIAISDWLSVVTAISSGDFIVNNSTGAILNSNIICTMSSYDENNGSIGVCKLSNTMRIAGVTPNLYASIPFAILSITSTTITFRITNGTATLNGTANANTGYLSIKMIK